MKIMDSQAQFEMSIIGYEHPAEVQDESSANNLQLGFMAQRGEERMDFEDAALSTYEWQDILSGLYHIQDGRSETVMLKFVKPTLSMLLSKIHNYYDFKITLHTQTDGIWNHTFHLDEEGLTRLIEGMKQQGDAYPVKRLKKESIYQIISTAYDEGRELPILKAYFDGRRDIIGAFFVKEVPVFVQEGLAMEMMALIVEGCGGGDVKTGMLRHLTEAPLYSYYTRLNNRIRIYLQERLIDAKQLYSFGMSLTTESEAVEIIKIGILIIGHYEQDMARHALLKLGLYGAFTLYVLEASRQMKQFNLFTYQLARRTAGFGKMAALHLLMPVTQEMREWVMLSGSRNEHAPAMSSVICLEKADMAAYLLEKNLDEASFDAFSYLFAHAFERNNVKSFAIGLPLVEKYLAVAPVYAKTFTDLSALVAILRSMKPYWLQPGVDVEKENGWTSNAELAVREAALKLLEGRGWQAVVLQEMASPNHPSSQIMAACEQLEMSPPFEAFSALLKKEPFDFEVFAFMTESHPGDYFPQVIRYLESVLPAHVFGGARDIEEGSLDSAHAPDLILVFALRAMAGLKIYDEALLLRCLSCRINEGRTEALKSLRIFMARWSDGAARAIRDAVAHEPVPAIRRRANRLLKTYADGGSGQERYIDLEDIQIKPRQEDQGLFRTFIAGAAYHDLLELEEVLAAGEPVHLIRENGNPSDENAVLIAGEDGFILGYLPRRGNEMPAILLDSGVVLYGIIERIDRETSRIEIKIMMQKS